jgi:hypothetical protein
MKAEYVKEREPGKIVLDNGLELRVNYFDCCSGPKPYKPAPKMNPCKPLGTGNIEAPDGTPLMVHFYG